MSHVMHRFHFIEEGFPRNIITANMERGTRYPVSDIIESYLRRQCYPCGTITLLTQYRVPIAPDTPWNEIEWGPGGGGYFRVEDREPVIALLSAIGILAEFNPDVKYEKRECNGRVYLELTFPSEGLRKKFETDWQREKIITRYGAIGVDTKKNANARKPVRWCT